MLDDSTKKGYSHIVSWSIDGLSFKIHDNKLMIPIMTQYFRQTKYKSLLRQLQGYNFTRITRGENKGIVSHPLFIRGKHDICSQMKRKKSSSGVTIAAAAAAVAVAVGPSTTTEDQAQDQVKSHSPSSSNKRSKKKNMKKKRKTAVVSPPLPPSAVVAATVEAAISKVELPSQVHSSSFKDNGTSISSNGSSSMDTLLRVEIDCSFGNNNNNKRNATSSSYHQGRQPKRQRSYETSSAGVMASVSSDKNGSFPIPRSKSTPTNTTLLPGGATNFNIPSNLFQLNNGSLLLLDNKNIKSGDQEEEEEESILTEEKMQFHSDLNNSNDQHHNQEDGDGSDDDDDEKMKQFERLEKLVFNHQHSTNYSSNLGSLDISLSATTMTTTSLSLSSRDAILLEPTPIMPFINKKNSNNDNSVVFTSSTALSPIDSPRILSQLATAATQAQASSGFDSEKSDDIEAGIIQAFDIDATDNDDFDDDGWANGITYDGEEIDIRYRIDNNTKSVIPQQHQQQVQRSSARLPRFAVGGIHQQHPQHSQHHRVLSNTSSAVTTATMPPPSKLQHLYELQRQHQQHHHQQQHQYNHHHHRQQQQQQYHQQQQVQQQQRYQQHPQYQHQHPQHPHHLLYS